MSVLVLVCLLSAQPGSPEERLAEAEAALDALEMERAAALLEPLVATPGLADGLRSQAWLALGLTRASLLDTDGARAAFTAALAIDAHLELPAGTSPKVQQLFDRTRQALAVEVRPPSEAPVASTPPSSPTSPPMAPDPIAPGTDVAGARLPWLIAGGALLAGGAVAAGVALVAEDSLGRPVAGRTREDYVGTRDVGVGALGASAVMLAGSALVLVAAFAFVGEPG